MKKVKVSVLSYTNSIPFVYGLEGSNISEHIEMQKGLSMQCASRLASGEVDLALVPVAALHYYPEFKIVGDYCIGAEKPVNSVFIFSNLPISQIRSIKFDPHSRTSNHLAKVLFNEYWKIAPTEVAQDADAFVLIGDATFGRKDEFSYVYDLAEEWIDFTGRPFAFAVWAANKDLEPEFLREFNQALKFGVDSCESLADNLPKRSDYDLYDYLTNRISYPFDEKKQEAVKMFLHFISALTLPKPA